MDVIQRALNRVHGGRVLDIATQAGGFVQLLMDHLQGYSEIVGIDVDARAIQTARNILGRAGVRFLVMDAERLGFADGRFDTVSISASLHHLSNVRRVLGEMRRVLKPGGHFILAEMHRDAQTAAQRTAVSLHHWVAEVDTALGRLHNRTLARQEFVDHIARLGLRDVACYDAVDTDSDPLDQARIAGLEALIERTLQRAQGASDYS
ncbi:methyltransferase domain-containing protein, partial [candidate division KSB3 bacterium]|nr:methyltransferase domain-containing protein [candidate division KSB3 bacterium]